MSKSKKIFTLSLFASALFANADQYNVIVSQEHNEYTPTEWSKTGNQRCSTESPLTTEVYFNQNFQQTHSGCEEEYINTVGGTKWESIPDFTTSEIGEYVTSSCLNIKNFDGSLPDGTYSIDVNNNGNLIDVSCDMTSDGGGWMNVANISGSYSVNAPIVNIDDKGVVHTEILYKDNGAGSTSDYAVSDSSWIWQGMDIRKNVIKSGGQWRLASTSPDTCLNVPNTIPVGNYRIITNNTTTCKHGTSNDPSQCGRMVAVTLPNEHKFEGFGDTESVYNSCNPNNGFTLNYSLYIR